jgi:REP-associated tyrosine transposase
MATPHRPQFPNAIYHVTVRGVNRQKIVRDDVDCEVWVHGLDRSVRKVGTRLHAWCLMTNHVHLLVETPNANLADFMQHLNSGYARAYNRRHGRVGHLYQDRYYSIVIEREEHLLEVVRYIVLNPVRAGICSAPEDWPWSSHRATAGIVPKPRYLTTSWILEQFARDADEAARRYAQFVAEGAPAASIAGILSAH